MRTLAWVLALAVLGTGIVLAGVAVRYAHDDSHHDYLSGIGWPGEGQAAYALGDGAVHASPGQQPVPIASVAKVMTAYLVLRDAPLHPGQDGFTMTVSAEDVAQTALRKGRDESVVRIKEGERLSERQALMAVLLPSANNVAQLLAAHVADTTAAFVTRMNQAARSLGMTHTTYTDPSGFDDATVSTAADQVTLAQAAMRDPTFAAMVRTRSFRLPVAGTVHNTDVLIGHDGFVGIKTGSDDAAGGCFAFRADRTIDGRAVVVTGVVLGQPGHNLILAGQYAARQFLARLPG